MFLLKNVNVIDGTGGGVQPGCSIMVKEGKIAEIGSSDTVVAPEGASVIEGRGFFAMPALMDAHTHMSGSSDPNEDDLGRGFATNFDFAAARDRCLRWGVTTVRSGGELQTELKNYQEKVVSGEITMTPRVIAPGRVFQAKDGHPGATVWSEGTAKDACIMVDDTTDIETEVQKQIDDGIRWIKVFYAHIDKTQYPGSVPRLTEGQFKRIIDAAHAGGAKVMVHVDSPEEMAVAARLGVDTIEHIMVAGCMADQVQDEWIDDVVESGAAVVPTIVCFKPFEAIMPVEKDTYSTLAEIVKRLHERGIRIGVGCDSGVPFVPHGESVHNEMANLVELGLSETEVIKLATSGNAEILGVHDELGTLEQGKLADILLLGSNPLDDILNTKDIKLVVKEGKIMLDHLFNID